ncbi:MAG: nucleoside recognition domain-containing protein [Clostridia bacterium]|nr:nucleoside recognition domain-containing protein [Clostridia bacterium]
MKYYKTYHVKNIIKLLLFVVTLAILLLLSKQNFESVRDSVVVFLSNVLPSLFPFILFTEVVLHTNIVSLLSRIFGKITAHLFKVDKNCTSAIMIGFLCGFPMGAKTVSSLYQQNKISRRDAKVLLSFVNNCNPAFILSTIGIAIFYQLQIGIILLISHIISSILIGIVYSRIYHNDIIHENSNILNTFNKNSIETKKNMTSFEILKLSILNTFKTLANILGFIIIFNLLFTILSTFLLRINTNDSILAFISSLFEVTKGCSNLNSLNVATNLRILLVSFALGFSGFCIICQVYSTVCNLKFKLKDIIIPKIFHSIISMIITYILLGFMPNNEVSTVSAFSNNDPTTLSDPYMINIKFYYLLTTLIIIFSLLVYRFFLYTKKKKNKKSSLPK